MKKLVSLLLCVIMVMTLMSISASAEEPITLTIERSEHASFTYSLEQPVIKELEKRLGIKLEIHAYPSSDFNTKLKIQLGTDDLPDIVCNTYSKLVDYVSEELLNAWEIPASILPELHPSTDIAGTITQRAALETGLLEGTPVVIGGGDGSCACVGAGVVQDKHAYCVLGSSSWISAASREPVFDPKKRTFNWVHLDPCLYTPCGTMQAAGYSYRWFCNTLCDAEKQQAQENEKNVYDILNERVKHTPAGAGGLLYLPYLLGERSPRWDSKVRGAFLGLSVTTGKAEMARAVMEGVGMNLYVILQALKTQVLINRLALIGGGAQGDVWPQILADIWGMPVETAVHSIEATSMGAAICAGVGIGLYRSFREAFVARMETRIFNPDRQANAVYRKLCPLFEQAYESLGKVSDGLALFRESAE